MQLVSKTTLAIIVVTFVAVTAVGYFVHISSSNTSSEKFEIPSKLVANAQTGTSLIMHIQGNPQIDPSEPISLLSYEWHVGSVIRKSSSEDKPIRVKFCFEQDIQSESSCWIRVTQPYAGKNWGAMFIPRIGHEVIVNYLEGDPDRPIIVGKIVNSDVSSSSHAFKLSESGAIMEIILRPKTMQWEFKDFTTGESFCGGIDLTSNMQLPCQQIL